MAANLVDLIRGYLTPDLMDKAASYVGESGPDTSKALGAIVPTTVAALSNLAATKTGAQQISQALAAGKYDGSLLGNVGSLFGNKISTDNTVTAGKGLLDSLFGNSLGSMTDLIARASGIRAGSASSLMALIAPLIMHVLGRQQAAAGGGVSALTNLLGEQRGFLGGLLPSGMASLLGWSGVTSGLSDVASATAGAASRATREVAAATSRTSDWWIPLAAVAALILLAIGYMSWWAPAREAARVATTKLAELQLPGGFKISVPEGAFNFSLATWLASTSDTTVPKRFVFDNLNFESGTTTLTPESRPTVDSLTAILKAYPSVSVGLEGYTDSTGDAEANKKLSLDRAAAVKNLLVGGGVAESRIATAGYGPDKPVASNETEEGRAKNRRLELVVEKR